MLKSDYEKAIVDFEKALSVKVEANPPSPLYSLGFKEINLRLWEACLKLGNREKAEKQKNILLSSENDMELIETLFFCRKYKLFETIVEVGKKIIEINKKSSLSFTAIGYALNQLGDYPGAIEWFTKEEKSSEKMIDNINLGISYWGLKDFQKANDYFEKANRESNLRRRSSDFTSKQGKSKIDLSKRVWLKVMSGNSRSALHSIDEYLHSKHIDINEFYDLRDWGAVEKDGLTICQKGLMSFMIASAKS